MRGLQRLCASMRQAATTTGLQQLAMPHPQNTVPWGQPAALLSCALQANSWLPCITSSRVRSLLMAQPSWTSCTVCLACMPGPGQVVLCSACCAPQPGKAAFSRSSLSPDAFSCPCTAQGRCVGRCIPPDLPCRASAPAPLLLSQRRSRVLWRGRSSTPSRLRQTQAACLHWRARLVSTHQPSRGSLMPLHLGVSRLEPQLSFTSNTGTTEVLERGPYASDAV